jgi:hypothetical protein
MLGNAKPACNTFGWERLTTHRPSKRAGAELQVLARGLGGKIVHVTDTSIPDIHLRELKAALARLTQS